MNSVNLKKMRFISIVWGLILFLIVASLTAFGFFYKNQTKEFKNFENLLETKVEKYVETSEYIVDGTLKITGEELVDNKIIESLNIKNHKCEAYVLVVNKNNNYKYEVYLKCGNYKTNDYDKNK